MTQRREDVRSTSLEWLDRLPAEWDERDIGREVWVRARLGWKGLTADEYVDEGVPMLATPEIKTPSIDYAGANKISRERYDESPEIMLTPGDVLLTKDGATIGTVNVVRDLPGPVTVNGSIAVLTPKGSLDGRFLYWFIASSYAQSTFDRLRGGMGVPHLFQRDINRIKIPYPPPAEQRLIADFLDRETVKIDALIAEQQGLVSVLKERRASVVAQALSDSDWPMSRLKRLAAVQTGVTLGGEGDPSLPSWPYLRVANVQVGFVDLSHVTQVHLSAERAALSTLREGDVLMTEGGDIDKLGRGALWRGEVSPMLHQNHVFAVRAGSRLSPEFLVYWLDAPLARSYFRTTAKQTTNLAATNKWTLGNLPVPAPPLVVQDRVVAMLNEETAKTDELITEAQGLVAVAKERRAALITAAVTGQIDVRGEVA